MKEDLKDLLKLFVYLVIFCGCLYTLGMVDLYVQSLN